jgi:predicted DNA-binding transcriptional regulator YafY
MARNQELVRQWEILREIDGARNGVSIPKLAAMRGVHERTIRRDIDALCRAGFPLYDEKFNGTPMWKLRAKPFRGIEETGLALTELCALYLARRVLDVVGGAPLRGELDRAFVKIERALPPPARKFLDALPRLMQAKPAARKKDGGRHTRDVIARAIDAALNHRRVDMRYYSASSGRTKQYLIEPQRIAQAEGGMYLFAYVPEYAEVRAFAAERIKTLAVRDDHFEPRPLPTEPFANSLGVHTGDPERIEILFDARTAPFVLEREWHPTQKFEPAKNGGVRMTMSVCNDYALQRWILSWGRGGVVVAPRALAQTITAELENAASLYHPRLESVAVRDASVTPVMIRDGVATRRGKRAS